MARRNTLAVAFLAAYSVAIVLSLPRLPLWLDEILALITAGKPDLPALLEHLRTHAGATPLGLIAPYWSMKALGASAFSGRLPSAVASVVACIGVWILARRSQMKWPLAALALFATCPLQFRYAMEARPYAQALCLSIWATVLVTAPWTRWRAAAYSALVLASGITLAYALFVPAGHFLWLLVSRGERRKIFWIAGSGLLTAAVLLPWYLHFREDWANELAGHHVEFWNWRGIFVFLREITGAGYLGTALAATGAGIGARRVGSRHLWPWWLLTPIVLVPIGNAIFNYFFAVRLTIYVLAPLALLFALGAGSAGRWGCVLLAVLLAAFVYVDVKWVTRPREDWGAAADRAMRELQSGGCVAFVPLDAENFYGYMRPELPARQCPLGPPADGGPVVLAVSPYDPENAYPAVREALGAQGYQRRSTADFTGPRVEVWAAR